MLFKKLSFFVYFKLILKISSIYRSDCSVLIYIYIALALHIKIPNNNNRVKCEMH